MAYTDIISLADAKVYLGVDDTAKDAEITRQIAASLSWIERQTNHVFEAADKSYIVGTDGSLNVHDYPINTDLSQIDATTRKKSFYTAFTGLDTSQEELSLNVGYAAPADIPAPLIEAGYMAIKAGYDGEKYPESIYKLIQPYRRFYL